MMRSETLKRHITEQMMNFRAEVVGFFFFFSPLFYLNITSCYNTYITYKLTDIDSKID